VTNDITYWQIAAGAEGREYSEDFIRYGLAFVGGHKQCDRMKRVRPGDRILLKRGLGHIVAAGEVVERNGVHSGDGDKDWLRDYDGWDLQAYCFVEWHKPSELVEVQGLTYGTIHRIHTPHVRREVDRIIDTEPPELDYEQEPHDTRTVNNDEILSFLIREGLRPGDAEELTATFNRVRLLARYYYDQDAWDNVREHETRTYLVIPLLLALGWAEQQMKIELPVKCRGRADLACFARPYAGKKDAPVLIIETKGFTQGLDYATQQVKRYAKQFPDCWTVTVTNGYCYKTFRKEGAKFSRKPSAYLNLLRPRDRYPLDPDNVDGCLEALRLLLPTSYYEG